MRKRNKALIAICAVVGIAAVATGGFYYGLHVSAKDALARVNNRILCDEEAPKFGARLYLAKKIDPTDHNWVSKSTPFGGTTPDVFQKFKEPLFVLIRETDETDKRSRDLAKNVCYDYFGLR